MRKPILAGNWKLHKTIAEAIELVTLLKRSVTEFHAVDVVVCPPFTALSGVSEVLIGSEIRLGAQDVFWEEKGAFTGEVSAGLLKDAGCAFVIVGHSERRQFFHETHETVNKKAQAAIRSGLSPIVCVGETLAERENGATFGVLKEQLNGAFAGFSRDQMDRVILAYEPVWAIGTGKVATPAQAQEAHAFIRAEMARAFGAEAANAMRIQYGGSVKPENITELIAQTDIDGALVGGASLDAAGFAAIVKNSAKKALQAK